MQTLTQKEIKSIVSDINRKKVEFTDSGLMVLNGGVQVQGYCELTIRKHNLVLEALEKNDPEYEAYIRNLVAESKSKYGYEVDSVIGNRNLVPTGGLNFILGILYGSTTKVSTWYAAIFTSDSTPAVGWLSNWAGASSGPVATELPDASYNESGRQALVFSSAADSGEIQSDVGGTTFTLATGVSGVSAYGMTVNSISTVAYNSTDRILSAATRFDASGGSTKAGLSATDELGCRYKLTIANA